MSQTIGLLYPGEMGVALASIFQENGARVISTISNRSDRTAMLAHNAKLELYENTADVIDESDVVLSVVPPNAAFDTAANVAESCGRRRRELIYVDANSISPMTTTRIEELFAGSPISIVDAAIHGLAANLPQTGVCYLSGPDCASVSPLFAPLQTEVVGENVGDASLQKMLLGGLSKGLAALFLELSLAAENAQITESYWNAVEIFYPELLAFLRRYVPTFRQHASRRSEELREVASTVEACGVQPEMVAAAQRRWASIGDLELADRLPDSADLADMLNAIASGCSPVIRGRVTPTPSLSSP